MSNRDAVPDDPFGNWIEVESNDETWTGGELIAVNPDNLFLLDPAGYFVSVPLDHVHTAILTRYKSEAGYAVGAMFLGIPATLSHGHSAIVSAPVWFLMGGISSVVASNENSFSFPEHTWEEFRVYARFPQGLPASVSQTDLKPKPPGVAHGGITRLYVGLYFTCVVQLIIGLALASAY